MKVLYLCMFYFSLFLLFYAATPLPHVHYSTRSLAYATETISEICTMLQNVYNASNKYIQFEGGKL